MSEQVEQYKQMAKEQMNKKENWVLIIVAVLIGVLVDWLDPF